HGKRLWRRRTCLARGWSWIGLPLRHGGPIAVAPFSLMAGFGVERHPNDGRRNAPAAYVDLDRRPWCRLGGRKVARADSHPDRWADRAAAHRAGGYASNRHRVPGARESAFGGGEPHELPGDAARSLRQERVAADKFAFTRLDHPSEIGLEGCHRIVDVVAVERHSHLETQGITGAEPGRRYGARPIARRRECAPQRDGVAGGHIQLEPVLAGVAGARDDGRNAGDRAFGEMVVRDRL